MRGFLAAAAVAGACMSAGSAPPPEGDGVEPDEPFEVRMEEEQRLSEESTVRFVSVVGDSRCPRDVTCIWEGDAEIELLLSRAGEQATLRLHSHPDRSRQAAALGYTLRLESLDPYPRTSDPIPASDYVATLVMTSEGPEGAPEAKQ